MDYDTHSEVFNISVGKSPIILTKHMWQIQFFNASVILN